MDANIIRACDYITPSLSITDSADRVAKAAIERLIAQQVVTISLAGVRGGSSSFFNVILQTVSESLGSAVLAHRLRFIFDSPEQETLYKRSLSKFRRAAI